MFWQAKTLYEFGPFRLDPRERRLLRDGEEIPLTPKVFDILLTLVQHSGHIMTKDEIMRLVWPDATVEDGNIARNISTLRTALGERSRDCRYIETIPWRGYRFVASVKEVRDQSRGPAFSSIAVLPLVNTDGDPEIEYLADGITENLITSLSQLPRLKVMSRNSAFRYKGRQTDAQSAGRELNVQAVLMGRVARRDYMLSISVELVNAVDDSQIWGAQYYRKLDDIFSLEVAIAREITERLRLRLSGPEQERLARTQTDNTEAYHSYLKGRYYFNKLTIDGVQKGCEQFRQAIKLDSRYALAYTGLGDCCNYLGKPSEAREAFATALELEPGLGEAHASLGFLRFIHDWDFAEAEKEFKQALEFNPNCAQAHHWYAIFLGNMARHQEAETEAKMAQELDPLSLLMNMTPALTFYVARRYEDSLDALQKIIEMEPNFPAARGVRGNVYTQMGRFDEAMREYQKVLELSTGVPALEMNVRAITARLHARRGDWIAAREILDEASRAAAEGMDVSACAVAAIHNELGDLDAAFEWLEKARQRREPQLASLKVDPSMDGLRGDLRFPELVKRVGLPESPPEGVRARPRGHRPSNAE
jgi:TolB-like protein/Tfp pilus assembly protein PilF